MHRHNITRVLGGDVAVAPAAAGQTAVNGIAIDTRGCESIAFLVQFGAITAGAVTSIKLQQGSAADGSDAVDIPGSSVTVPDTASNKGVWSAEVHRPSKRYVRPVVVRGTQNAVVAGGFALLGRSGVQPAPAGAAMANAPGDVPVVVTP